MTKAAGTITIDTAVDTKGIEQSLPKIESGMSKIGDMAKKVGKTITAVFAVREVVNFGKECLELGSDLAEVQNVVDVTFSTMSDKVDTFAKSALKSYGLSETMAKQYTGTFGAMAKAFGFAEQQAYDMSASLTGLTGDVASFYNLSQGEAYTKLKSVFTGETESLKDLGVVMTQSALDQYALANGYGKTTAAMTEQEKVALRFAFVQDQLSLASGDFIRTSGSWANQVRIMQLQIQSLKATIGHGLINIFTPVIKVINILLEKLATVANAFKAFTELLTGGKSTESAPIQSAGSGLSDLESGYNDAAGGAENLAGSTQDAADATGDQEKATKKATKAAVKYLSPLDEINRYTEKDKSSGSSAPSGGASGGAAGGGAITGAAVDFGSVAQGETEIEKMSGALDALIERCRQLAALFRKGFRIGFGDSEQKIKSITSSIKGIGQSLAEIFTDPRVVAYAKQLTNSVALALGKITGAVSSIGLTLADLLFGSLERYLKQNSGYLKGQIVAVFDIASDIAGLAGDYAVAAASIFDVFSGDTAKQCGADLLGIFTEGFLGVKTAGLTFVRDVASLIIKPLVANVDGIRLAFENILAPVSTVLGTLHTSLQTTFGAVGQMYNAHIKPAVDGITAGISNIVALVLDGFNTYIAPVLQSLTDDFDSMWNEHVQPAISDFINLIGKLADSVKKIWDKTLQPFIEWIAENFGPVLAPIIKKVGEFFIDAGGVIGDTVSDIISALGGIIDFLTGVFTGDWQLAWTGVDTFLKGIWNGIVTFLTGIWEAIKKLFAPVADWFKEKFEAAKENIHTAFESIGEWFGEKYAAVTGAFSDVGEWFRGKFEDAYRFASNAFSNAGTYFGGIWDNIKSAFGNITDWFSGEFKSAWEAVKRVFSKGGRVFTGIKDGILSGLKSVINGLISGINRVIAIPFSGINDALNTVRNTQIFGWYPFSGLPPIETPQIPELASGAVIPPRAEFLAVLGDQKNGRNLEAPESLLRKIVREESGQGGGNYRFTAMLNRRTIFDEIIEEAKLRQTTSGCNPFELA